MTESTPPAKNWTIGRIAKWALIALILIIAVQTCSGIDSGAPEKADSPAVAPVAVSAVELAAAYEANEAAAQQRFGNSPLLVSATIQSISLGLGDEPFLVLKGTNQFMGPQAKLDAAGQAAAANLSKGQKITLLCTGLNEALGTPMLSDCSIQP